MADVETSPLCSARAETEASLERELFRLSRLLDGVCSRLLDVERRLSQTEERCCHIEESQQAQTTLQQDVQAVLKKVPSEVWMKEAEARQEEVSQSCLRAQEQVHALVDFLAQEHVRLHPQGRADVPQEKEISRASRSETAGGPDPSAVAQLAQRAEDPLLSERLRRIFSPPSRGNSVDSPPREDFISKRGGEGKSDPQRVVKVVKVSPPVVPECDDPSVAPCSQAADASRTGMSQRSASKGATTPGVPITAPATPTASPQVEGLVGQATAAMAQGNPWVQRSVSGRATPTKPVARHLSAGTPGVPGMPQFGRPPIYAASTPMVAVASSTQPAMRCQRVSAPAAALQPRHSQASAPAPTVQVKRDPRLSQTGQSVMPAAQVPQPLPLPPGSTGPRAQYDL